MQVNANSRVKTLMVSILVLVATLAFAALYLSNRPETAVSGPSAPHEADTNTRR
ncbi:hypothetical protein J2T09_003504 [Neorhizobium huautlense]|uniref:Uncharacterized protein n=1 Tax=Neorhizobium huautlense TaxID=67774 RepID=A0ABT9PWF5_9HYPH|nr:hypothetical protein [Neorhizobium huautlense]